MQNAVMVISLLLVIILPGVFAQRTTNEDHFHTSPTSVTHHVTEHNSGTLDGSGGDKNIRWGIPAAVILLLIIVAIFVGMGYTVYRARYGAFCCITPKLSFRLSSSDDIESSGNRYQEPSFPPPTYDTHQRSDSSCHSPPPTYESTESCSEHPPDYQDALQDVILNSHSPYWCSQPCMHTHEPPTITVAYQPLQEEPITALSAASSPTVSSVQYTLFEDECSSDAGDTRVSEDS